MLVLTVLTAAAVIGLGATTGGTRWVAGQARQLSGGLVDWDSLDGRLLGTLRLAGLRVRSPGTAVDIATLELAWSPGALLLRRLQVDSLQAGGIRVRVEETPPQPQEDTGPLRLEDFEPPLAIRIDALQLQDIDIALPGQAPQHIDRAELAAGFEDGTVSLQHLRVIAPQGNVSALGEGGLRGPLPLSLDASWAWQLPDQRQTSGTLRARGDARQLTLQLTAAGDFPAQLHGTLRDLLEQPAWDLQLEWPELAPLGTGDTLRVGPGKLGSTGSLQDYQLTSEGSLSGPTPDPVNWSLKASGNADSIRLDPLVLRGAPGEAALQGTVSWKGGISAQLGYSASAVQLDTINPELPPQLDVHGQLQAHYAGEQAELTKFELAAEQSPLTLSASGSVKLPTGAPPDIDARLQWKALQWPLQGDTPGIAVPLGELTLQGSPEAWQLALETDVAGSQLPPGHWTARAVGDGQHMQLQELLGQLLGGELRVQGDLGWAPQPSWALTVHGDKLDPGKWLPDLPGQLALALESSGSVDSGGAVNGSVVLQKLDGTLAGRELALRAKAALAGENITLDTLTLRSGGNSVQAQGALSPQQLALDWQLQAPQPGALLAGLSGQLQAQGKLSGTPDAPQLQARIDGSEIGFEGQSLASLHGELQAGLDAQAPLRVDLQLGTLSQGEAVLLDAASLNVTGTTAEHRLQLQLDAPADNLHAELAGGLVPEAGAWQGELAALSAHTAGYGDWALAKPAPLRLTGEDQQLGETCLQAQEDASRVCASAGRSVDGAVKLDARVGALDLARFSPEVIGQMDGVLQGQMAADGALDVHGVFAISPGQLRLQGEQGAKSVSHRGGHLTLNVTSAGMNSDLYLQGEEQRLLEAHVQLPEFKSLPLQQPQPLRGRVLANLDDLGGLQALVPQLENTRGSLHADMQLAGTLEKPQVLGEFALADAAADVPLAGLELRDIQLRATGDALQPGLLNIVGGMASGPGRVDINGSYHLDDGDLELELAGENLQVYDTADARALLSPDLRIGWDGEILKLRGVVAVPQADITPRLQLSPGMATAESATPETTASVIAPSPDVVVIDAEGEVLEPRVTPPPVRLDSSIELQLGKKVRVRAVGFNGRVTGGATFTNTPDAADLMPIANGRLEIEGGTFRAFGQDLQIETGKIIYTNVPASEPELSLRAVRWIDNDPLVSAAGVQVTGALDQPLLVLFSQPLLDPTEIQSYLLTGHSPSSRDSVLSIGTYVMPKLYVGYGYNVIAETSEFDALYTITPRYGIQATAGEADNRVNLTFTLDR